MFLIIGSRPPKCEYDLSEIVACEYLGSVEFEL